MTSYTPDIVLAAKMGLEHVFRKGYGYKTVMITLYELRPAAYQGYLWIDPREDIKKRDFMEAIDKLSEKYGRQVVTLGKGLGHEDWEMKREYLSPCWTTNIEDFPKIR